jgi:GxxExxY protein
VQGLLRRAGMLLNDDSLNQLTGLILAAAIEVHRILGPGLLESIYIECLEHELRARGLAFVRQLTVPITYKGTRLRSSYRVDLILDDRVVVEVKSVERVLAPVCKAQVLTYTYMRVTGKPVGLLINFNVPASRQHREQSFLKLFFSAFSSVAPFLRC